MLLVSFPIMFYAHLLITIRVNKFNRKIMLLLLRNKNILLNRARESVFLMCARTVNVLIFEKLNKFFFMYMEACILNYIHFIVHSAFMVFYKIATITHTQHT